MLKCSGLLLLAVQVYGTHLRSEEPTRPVLLHTQVAETHLRTEELAKPLAHTLVHVHTDESEEGPIRTIYHAKDEVPPLGTCLYSCINLGVQYFFVYTGLALVTTYADLRLGGRSGLVAGLRSALAQATQTVSFAPMLALLFLVIDMRFKAAGATIPRYSDIFMLTATYALGVQTLVVLCLPIVTGEIAECEDDGSLKSPAVAYGVIAKFVYAIKVITLIALYAGICGCMYALFGPDSPKSPPTPPAVHCIALLCGIFFGTGLCLAIVREVPSVPRITAALAVTSSVASMAPMVGILFAAARVRALQVRPDGNPQHWAQICFYAATYAICTQVVLVLVCALFGGEPVKSRGDGDFGVQSLRPSLYFPLTAGRYLAMIVMYSCVVSIMVSVFVLRGPDGTAPHVSTAVIQSFILAIAFFVVYLMLFVLNTLRDVLYHRIADGYPGGMGRVDARMHHAQREAVWVKWIKTAESARLTVQFCPMLAVLFLAVRWRALQVTDQNGGPQPWSQMSMIICTGCVLVQLAMVVAVALVQDRIPETSKAGVVLTQPSNIWVKIPFTILRYVAFVGLYGGLIAVLSSTFLIMPETASPIE